MKTILISLLVLIAANSQAEQLDSAPSAANLNLTNISANMTSINPMFQSPTGAQVNINGKDLELTVARAMPPCGPNMMCMQMMPAPLDIVLEVVQVVQTPCSVKYIASTPASTVSLVFEEVVVEDFSNTKCEMLMKNIGSVTYKATGVSALSSQPETATAKFVVQGQFIRASN